MRILFALFCSFFLIQSVQAEILIGVAGPLSGQNAAFGIELRTGATAAIAAINAQGGINGENLGLVEGDDGCDSKRAVDVAKDFVTKDVRFVVGHFCSTASLAAAPTYAEAGILMMSPSANATELTTKNLWNVFRLAGREDVQGELAAARIKALGQGAEVLLISDQQVETAAIAKSFQNALPKAKSINIKAGSAKLPDDAGLLTATAAYLALQAMDAGTIAEALQKLNPGLPLYGPDLLQSEAYTTRAGASANGTRVTYLTDWASVADPKKQNAIAVREGATLAAYAAVEVFANTAKARSVNDSRAMAAWLAAGNETSSIVGPIRFNASGDLQKQPYIWYVWRDGALVPDQQTP